MLNFTRSQRNGLIVLAVIILVSLSLPKLNGLLKKNYQFYFSQFEKEIEQAKKANPKVYKEKTKPIIFEFNPNTVSEHEMMQLGLNEKQMRQILNFRNKKGVFYKKEDFRKIYAIDDSTYSRLKDFIVIPENNKTYTSNTQKEQKIKEPEKEHIVIGINTASAEDLQKIKGIGTSFSNRIIKYRDALGGFVSKKQLLEVYGVDSLLYAKIENQISIDQQSIQFVKINFVTGSELELHPYFQKKLAQTIVKERTFNGRYSSIENLQKRVKMSHEQILKLMPYIEF